MLLNAQSKSPLADGIRRHIRSKKRNYNIIITGKTQTGKSTVALALAYGISKKFDMENNMSIIDAGKLLEILDNIKRKYTVTLADDFGVSELSSDDWHKFLAKALNRIIQTHGHLRPVFILTVPLKRFINSKLRSMFDMQITTLEKNDNERWVRVKVEVLNQKQIKNTIVEYKPFPRAKFRDGTIKRIDSIKIKFPPKKILEKYFEISKPVKMKLRSDLKAEYEQMEKNNKRQIFNLEAEVVKVLKNPERFVACYLGRHYIDKTAIVKECAVGGDRANQIKKEAERRLGDRIAEIQPASASGNEGGSGQMDSKSEE